MAIVPDNIEEKIDKIKAAGSAAIADLIDPNGKATVRTPIVSFPSDLMSYDVPIISFECTPYDPSHTIDTVYLPIPQGFTFTDGAGYDTIDLGTIAGVADIVSAGLSAGAAGGFTAGATAAAKKAFAQATSGGAIGASILLARKLPGMDGVAKSLSYAGKQIVNPRTNTAFTGNMLRKFSFDFKLVASNSSEAEAIRQIHNIFRNNLYASELGGEKVMLQYPGTWIIKFLDSNMRELGHIPKIYKCNLEQLSTSVNGDTNMYHEDNAPFQVNVSVQFQETKILTRNEMEALQSSGLRSDPDAEKFNQQIKDTAKKASDFMRKIENSYSKAAAKEKDSRFLDKAAEDIGGRVFEATQQNLP